MYVLCNASDTSSCGRLKAWSSQHQKQVRASSRNTSAAPTVSRVMAASAHATPVTGSYSYHERAADLLAVPVGLQMHPSPTAAASSPAAARAHVTTLGAMTLNQSHAVTSNVSTDAAAKPAAPPSPHPGTPTSTSGSSTTTTSRPLEVLVPRTWKGEEGDAIPGLPGLYVGPCFGSGALAYNHIHDVLTESGQSSGLALKLCKPRLAARRSLAHEWRMFKDLRLLGERRPGLKECFLQGERVLLEDPSRVIRGILMEKAAGSNVIKRLKAPGFANARYAVALLRDLLRGLAVAQDELGFAHYDLKLDNVMEHFDTSHMDVPAKDDPLLLVGGPGAPLPQFKVFDFGTAVVYPDPYSIKKPRPGGRPAKAAGELEEAAAVRQTSRPGMVPEASEPDLYDFSRPFCMVRLYHCWGQRAGDVYRVLASLGRHLDGVTWPLEDIELVSLLLTALEHSTAKKRLTAHFVPRAQLLGPQRLTQWRQALGTHQAAQKQQQQQQQQQVGDSSSKQTYGGSEAGGAVVVPSGVSGVSLARMPHRSLDAAAQLSTAAAAGTRGGSVGGPCRAGNTGGPGVPPYPGSTSDGGRPGVRRSRSFTAIQQLQRNGSGGATYDWGALHGMASTAAASGAAAAASPLVWSGSMSRSGSWGSQHHPQHAAQQGGMQAYVPAMSPPRNSSFGSMGPAGGAAAGPTGGSSRRLLEPYQQAMATAQEASAGQAQQAPQHLAEHIPPPSQSTTPTHQGHPGQQQEAQQELLVPALSGATSLQVAGSVGLGGGAAAPVEQQSVLGQRGAVKGVTARQLLQEPLLQLLFAKLNEGAK